VVIEEGKKYEITYEILDCAGTTRHAFVESGLPIFDYGTYLFQTNGIRTMETTAVRTPSVLELKGYTAGDNFSISNISIKEVKGGNDGTVSGSPETILLPEARNGRDTLGFPINNVNNGYLALHGDGYVEVADDDSLDCTEAITMEVWVKPNEYITTDGTATGGSKDADILGSKGSWGDTSSDNGGHLLLLNKQSIHVRAYGTASFGRSVLHGLVVGEWMHIVSTMSITDDEHKIYIDGDVVGDWTMGSSIMVAPQRPTVIGNRTINLDKHFNGSIDEPRIYNRSLTEAEVLQNYNAGKNKHRND
jgi:hypothetical protein